MIERALITALIALALVAAGSKLAPLDGLQGDCFARGWSAEACKAKR